MKILIMNGDSTSNRGDRTILMGNIILLKSVFPKADIRALSYKVKRDEEWYGIKFYKRSSLLEMLKAIRWSDIIMWGGGELIQDDTSKVKIPYWFVNIMILSILFRKKIIALGQGLGPVNSGLNKILSKILMNRLRLFFTRDNYSEKMIRNIGSKVSIISSVDPAILVSDKISRSKSYLFDYLKNKGFNINKNDKIVGVGVRRWFHQSGSLIPHKYAVKYGLRKIGGEKEFSYMKENLAFLLDELVSKHKFKIVFFPMYTPKHEADDEVSSQILNLMKNKNKGFVIKDDFSPIRYLELINATSLFFGVRLHSTILSTSLGIPSLTFYYVPKGKSYFEQLGMSENSFKIDSLLSREKTKEALSQFNKVVSSLERYKSRTVKAIKEMKQRLLKEGKEIAKYI